VEWRGISPASPVLFWDVFGKQGHPVRTTVSEMGPTLLANLLELNEIQEGVLQVAFSLADDEGLLLLDLKDLRTMLNWVTDNAGELEREYGRVSNHDVRAPARPSSNRSPAPSAQVWADRSFAGYWVRSSVREVSRITTIR
jgi:hypothetical protein